MKSFVEGFESAKNADMSADIEGLAVKSILLDIVLVKADWSGSSVDGSIVIEASMSSDPKNIKWYELESVEQAINTNTGEIEILIEKMCHGLIRPKYVRNTGTGTLNFTINGKSIGR